MKNFRITYFATLVALLFALTSCGGDSDSGSDEPVTPGDGSVYGEWQLTSFYGTSAMPELYLELKNDGKFNLYQRYTTTYFEHLTGTFNYKNNRLSGKYSDKVSWSDDYHVSLSNDGTKMTLTKSKDDSDVCVYTRCEIPEDVTLGNASPLEARCELPRFL